MFLKKTEEKLVLAIIFPWGFREIVLTHSWSLWQLHDRTNSLNCGLPLSISTDLPFIIFHKIIYGSLNSDNFINLLFRKQETEVEWAIQIYRVLIWKVEGEYRN